jgi:hypothetical protein
MQGGEEGTAHAPHGSRHQTESALTAGPVRVTDARFVNADALRHRDIL